MLRDDNWTQDTQNSILQVILPKQNEMVLTDSEEVLRLW
jgi:hypothetical protein